MSVPTAGLQHDCSKPKPKVVGRPWPKGTPGSPSSRRRGTLSPTAALKRVLTQADLEQVVTKLIDLAKAGDRHALRIVFDRLDGPMKEIAASAEAGASRDTVIKWPHELEAQRANANDGNQRGAAPMPG